MPDCKNIILSESPTCVVRKKIFLNETKNHNPPLQVKWSVPNIWHIWWLVRLISVFSHKTKWLECRTTTKGLSRCFNLLCLSVMLRWSLMFIYITSYNKIMIFHLLKCQLNHMIIDITVHVFVLFNASSSFLFKREIISSGTIYSICSYYP
jgi:hypothetical protein